MSYIMVQDCNAVWNGCLSVIREEISEQSFRTWFEPIRPIRLQENTLTLQVSFVVFVTIGRRLGCEAQG